jgi:hypothetical protein
MDEYDGRQFVGIDLHRQGSVIVRQPESGEQLSAVRIVKRSGRLGTAARAGWRRPRGGAGSDVRLVLGGRRATGRRSAGAFGASVGSQGIPLPASEERRARRRRSGRSAADGSTARGLDRPTEDARIAGAGALPRQAGRDPIRTKGPDGYTNLCQFTLEWDSPASLRRIGACSARCSSCLCMGLAPTNALNSRGRMDGPSSENPIA